MGVFECNFYDGVGTPLRDKCANLNLGWPPNLAEVLANKGATKILRYREIKEPRLLYCESPIKEVALDGLGKKRHEKINIENPQ